MLSPATSPRVLLSPPLSPRSVDVDSQFGEYSGDPLSDPSTETFAGESNILASLQDSSQILSPERFGFSRVAMSAIFDGYEKEFLELNSAVTRKTALIPTLQRGALSDDAWARSVVSIGAR